MLNVEFITKTVELAASTKNILSQRDLRRIAMREVSELFPPIQTETYRRRNQQNDKRVKEDILY